MLFDFKIIVLVLALTACQKANKASTDGTDYPHPNSPTGGMTNVKPATVKTVSKAVSATEATVLTLGSTTVTIPAGAIDVATTASLTSYGGVFLNSGTITMVSEPVLLDIVDMVGEDIERSSVHRDITVEIESATKVTRSKLALMFHENGGLATAAKTGIKQAILASELVATAGGKYKASFVIRPPRMAMVMATTGGALPVGYDEFISPPVDVTVLAGTANSPSSVTLTWKADATLDHTVSVVTAAGSTQVGECTVDNVVTATYDEATLAYSYQLAGLSDGVSYTFKVCGASFRDPVDLSLGSSVVVATPARAVAVLTNAPTGTSNLTALNVTVGGTGVTEYKYALLTGASDCTGATYSGWTPVATHITNALPGSGSEILCVLGRIDSTNAQLTPTTSAWTIDLIPPVFTSISLIGDATDLYVNSAEKVNTTDIVGSLAATGNDGANYAVAASATSCGGPLTYAAAVSISSDLAAVSDGTYKVCVQLYDYAGNITYGSSSAFTVDYTAPVFTSLSLANDAADGFINNSEKSLTNALTSAAAGSGFASANYVAALSSVTCDGALTYSVIIPNNNDAALSSEGTYKVCAQLVDPAGNKTYGGSANIIRKTTLPAFTSLALGADVTDTYLSIADHAFSNPLAAALVGANYDTAAYSVQTSGTTCDGLLTYGAVPIDSAAAINTNNQTYKVCVKLADSAGNTPTYGATSNFTALITQPTCTSVTLSGDVLDGYLNSTERLNTTAVVSGAAGASSAVSATNYSALASGAVCDATQTFVATAPKSNDAAFAVNGAYKVCARVADAAAQYGYCASANFTVNGSSITFTSIDLSGPATDTYINAAEHSANTANAGNLIGLNYDTAKYAVATSATTCDAGVTYGASVPAADDAGISSDGTSYKVCVELSDVAGNPKAYGSSATFIFDATAPVFTSIDLVNAATDTYINQSEHLLTTAVAGNLVAAGQSTTQHALVTSATTCGMPLTWVNTIAQANDVLFTAVGTYKLCVQLTDVAGNITYGNSPTINFDNVLPVFTSIALANGAADTYVNTADSGSGSVMVDTLVASGQDATKYKLATNASTCSALVGYSATVTAGTDFASLNGDYKVCVELSDNAENKTYGSSSVIHVDTTDPAFTSLALAGDAVDTYINTAEHAATNNLTGTVSGSGYDTAVYALVSSGTVCSGVGSWSSSIPKSNSSDFSADGAYIVCAKLTDNAGNPSAYGSSATITLDTTAPVFTSLALGGDAADNYLSSTDRTHTTTIIGTLTASGQSATTYKLVTAATTCDVALTYGADVKANTSDITADGSYKICAKLADAAGNISYGSSGNLTVNSQTPTFTSIDRKAIVSDGYLNIAEHATTAALVTSLVGTHYDTPQYAVATSATTCDAGVTYGASLPAANDAGISSDGTSYKVCVELSDVAGNPKAYGSSATFIYDATAPVFTSIDLVNAATDTHINQSEHLLTTAVAGNLVASGQLTTQYALVTLATTCALPLTWVNTIAQANDVLFTAVGTYKICVQLTDVAGNITYGNSPTINFDNVSPVLTSIALANGAADTYVNTADSGSGSVMVDTLVASGQDATKYKLATNASTCSALVGYSATVTAGTDFASLNGDYKVCVELSDNAENKTYGSSSVIHVDTTDPAFTSLALAGDAVDTYINTAEHAATNNLTGTVSGSGYDTAVYALVSSGTVCSGVGSWSSSIPKSNSSDFSADGAYIVCAKLTDNAGNPAAYGSSSVITLDTTAPVFTSLALGGDAADNYLSSTDRTHTTTIIGTLTASGQSATTYKLVTAATTCDVALTYGADVKANTSDITADGSYKICAKLADAAGNISYGSSGNLTVNTQTPTFASIARTATVIDGYLNIAEHATTAALVTSLVGTRYDTAQYAVATSATTCDAGVTYGASVPAADDAGISSDGTSYKVCVELSDVAGNPKAYGSSATFIFDATAPVFTSIDLVNAATDTYINQSEHLLTTAVADNLVASGQSTTQYALVTLATTCALPLTWVNTIAQANDVLFTAVGTYKICVQLTDVAGNITYGNSPTINFDNVLPVFTSIALANGAADTYVNTADSGSGSVMVDALVASGQDATKYKLATNASTCSALVGYSATVTAGTDFASLNGDYKVCVELSDNAENKTYGSSSVIHVDTTDPAFTSLALAGDAVDTYINTAEHAATNNLTGTVSGSGYDTAVYALVSSGTVCSGVGSWSSSIPKSNSSDFSADGAYIVCAKLTDNAGNPAAYGSSATITLDTTAPVFTSLALGGDAADNYLSSTDRTHTTTIIGTLTAFGQSATTYKLVTAATTCDVALTYGADVKANTSDITADGSYKICAKLADAAGNAAFGSTSNIAVDTAAPVFSSLALGSSVVDGYLNSAEHAASTSLGGTLTASGSTSNGYALVTSATSCDAAVTYGGMPNSDDTGLANTTTYKICVSLSDAAGNTVYGSSATFLTDFLAPSISLITLAAVVGDGYLTSADQTAASNLVTSVSASNQDTVSYAVAAAATTCGGALTYSATIPKTNDAAFTADGSWKVCVKASDTAGNTDAFLGSSTWVRDVTLPASAVTTSGAITQDTTAGSTTNISGTASDAGTGLASVYVSIQEGSGSCFDSAAHDFTTACPNWLSVTGTSSWTKTLDDSDLLKGQTYTVSSKAIDVAGNAQTSFGINTFTFTASEGTSLWNRDITYDGSSGDDRPLAGAVDSNGNLYVVGYVTNVDKNWLIKKFSKRGIEDTTNWNKNVGDVGVDEIARSVAVDTSGNVYVAGSRWNGSDWDWMIKKYSSSGVEDTANWDMLIDSGFGNDEALGVASDSSGNVYVVGYGRNLTGGSTSEDMWIKKFQSNGVLSCEQKLDEGASNLSDRANAVAVNNSSQKIFIAGYKTVTGPDRQMVVKRLRMSDCSIEATSVGNSVGTLDYASTIRVDSAGSVFVSGTTSSTDQDWWVRKYSAALALSSEFNTTVAGNHEALGLAVDSNSNVYVGGYKTGATQDLWLRQFSSTLVENTGTWDKVIDGASGNDQVSAVVISSGTGDTDNVYMIGWGTNLIGGASGADWWIRKYAGP